MDAIGRILQQDVHHAIGSRVRKRIEDDVAEDAVDDRDGADAEGQGQDGDRREPGRPAECSRRVNEIPPCVLQPAKRPCVALHFLRLFHAVESSPCGDAGIFRRSGRLRRNSSSSMARCEDTSRQLSWRAGRMRRAGTVSEQPEIRCLNQNAPVAAQALQDSSISSLSTNVARRRQRSVCFSSARVPDLVRL